MSSAPTWSDVLERVRKAVGDDSPCEYPASYELLNAVYSATDAGTQFHRYGGVLEPSSSALNIVASSTDFLYVLVEDSTNAYIAAVRRNPRK